MRRFTFFSIFISFICTICSAEIIYVKNIQDSPDAWLQRAPVYTSMQLALDNANSGDEIWVAKGTYFDSLVLKKDIKLFGGFVGDEYSINERILWNLKPISIIDGRGTNRCILANFNNTIDGFTLKNGGNVDRGAGIYVNNTTNIEIKNIFIDSCSVSWKGAGIFIETDKIDTIVIDRVVVWNCNSYCGSLEMDEKSLSTLCVKNCTIVDNNSYGLELPFHEEDDGQGNLLPIQPGVWDHSFVNIICWNNVNPYNEHAPNPETDTHDVWAWAREFLDYSYVGKNAWEDASMEGKWHGPKANVIFEKDPDWNNEPKFVDPENGDFRLLNDSPCLDAGMNRGDLGAYPSNDISGFVFYYNTQRSVPNVAVGLKDDLGESYNNITNVNGNYLFTNTINGRAEIMASKQNDQNDAIAGSDALLILQYLAFLTSLTDDQKVAADVTEDGNVSGSDAQAILRYLAFYSENTGSTGDWRFAPDTSVFIIQKDTTANFKAYLLGDANGNWSENSGLNSNLKDSKLSSHLKLSTIFVDSERIIKVPVRIENLLRPLHTAVFTLEYDPEILTYQAAEQSDSCRNFMMAANGNELGKVHFAMAGVEGINGDNDLVEIIFQMNNAAIASRTSELWITRAFINDFIVDQIQNAKIYFKNAINSVDSERLFSINNYPNPFNQATTISFSLPDAADVTLAVFNIQGQHIKTLLTEKLMAGEYQINWTAINSLGEAVPSGLYFSRLEIKTISTENKKLNRYSKKILLLR